MAGTLSPEGLIATILNEIGCAASNFSEIAGRGANSRVIAALRGANDFSREDGKFYLDVARQMKRLADTAGVPVSWKEVPRIKEILAARRAAVRPIPFAVIFIGPRLFKQVVDGKVETTSSYKECAAFKNPVAALEAAKILIRMGEREVRSTSITNQVRDSETIFGELSDFGFTKE